jgi:hypothetical protein
MLMMGFLLGGTGVRAFEDYCLSFYGEEGLDGAAMPGGFFTRREVQAAALVVANLFGDSFDGDSLDRERVREVVLFARRLRDVGPDAVARERFEMEG